MGMGIGIGIGIGLVEKDALGTIIKNKRKSRRIKFYYN